jgi:hypothetical protein
MLRAIRHTPYALRAIRLCLFFIYDFDQCNRLPFVLVWYAYCETVTLEQKVMARIL